MTEFESTFNKHRDLMLERLIREGVDDPAIFKAIFMAGGPGSGKTYVTDHMLGLKSLGFRPVDPDAAFKYVASKAGVDIKSLNIASPAGQLMRQQGSDLAQKQKGDVNSGYVSGRLGIIIDGTGKDLPKTSNQKKELESIGYETLMIFVNSDLETAQARNLKRDRKLSPEFVKNTWEAAQRNIGAFQSMFGSNFYVVDNNLGGSESATEDLTVFKKVSAWAKQPPRSPIAKKWIADNGGRK